MSISTFYFNCEDISRITPYYIYIQQNFYCADSEGQIHLGKIEKIGIGSSAASTKLRRTIRYDTVQAAMYFFDLTIIMSASNISSYLYQSIMFRLHGTYTLTSIDIELGIGVLAGLIFISQAKAFDLYNIVKLLDPAAYLSRVMIIWIFSIAFVTVILFLLRVGEAFSRGAISIFAISVLLLFCVSRLGIARALRSLVEREAIVGRRVVLIGEPSEMANLSPRDLLMHFGIKELARFAIGGLGQGVPPGQELAALGQAMATAREQGADELVIALSWARTDLISALEARLRASPLPARLLPDHVVRALEERWTFSTSGPVPTVELHRAPLGRWERNAKRTLDIVLATVAIFLLAPLTLMTAIAIKVDSSGPIIFRQRRTGFDGRVFSIFKFRTMTVLEDGAQITQSRLDDPRVTRLGRILRRTSIDELPQLFNVLLGDMSLVGPRPHAIAHDNQYRASIASYAFRHHVKPGITGWAQINGQRGATQRLEDMEKRVALDLWYVNNWSLMLDLRILWRTCFEVLQHNAY